MKGVVKAIDIHIHILRDPKEKGYSSEIEI